MPATQTIEFRAVTGQTVTAKLFAAGNDTEVASVTATEATNRKGTYTATFTDVAAGEYQLLAFNATPIPLASWWVTLADTTATYEVYEKANKLAIADQVWDEAYADHNVAGSFGKLLNTIRKANLAIEGTVSNAITPTTLTFSSNVSATTSAYAHAVLLFVSGPLTGENSPIVSYDNTNGVFVLEEPLTAAPSDGDEFVVIAGSHVHAIADIQSGLATSSGVTAAFSEIKGAGWSSATDTLEEIRDAVDAVPTAAENKTAVWNAATVDHTSTGSFGAGVGYIITTVAAILVAVNTLTSRISSGVAAMFADLITMITGSGTADAQWTEKALELAPGGGADTGARTVVITVTLGGNPVEGATVRLTKGAETKIEQTNVDGEANFNCDDGTWTVAITAPNASFSGDTLLVNGDEAETFAMTADSVTPSDPPYITGTYIALDSNHVPASGISFSFYAAKPTTLDGYGQKNNVRTTTSGTGGITSFTNLLPGTKYKIRRGTGEWYTVEIPADQTTDMDLTSLIGN